MQRNGSDGPSHGTIPHVLNRSLPTPAGARLSLREWTDRDREPFERLCADPVVMQHFPAPLTPAATSSLLDQIGQS